MQARTAVRITSAIALFLAVLSCSSCSRTGLDVGEPGSTDADAGAVVPCTPGTFTLAQARPAVMFVLDRSGSMDTALTGRASRWQVLTSALATTLPPVDGSMEIGALVYPTGTTSSASDPQSCQVPSSADLAPALGHAAPLLALLRGATPAGGTPTADAIDRAASLLLGVRAASTARALVLATDGAPDCNTGLDPRTCTCADTAAPCRRQSSLCLDDDRTVKRIAAQASSGLPTYVIGIQSENDTTLTGVLDAMAVAGGRPQNGAAHRYYAVSSESDLDAALVTIRDQVGSCTFLTGSVPGDQGSIVVSLGGVPIPYDPTGVTGWSWGDKSNGQIVFAGSTCTAITAATGGGAGGASAVLDAIVQCKVPDAGADAAREGGP